MRMSRFKLPPAVTFNEKIEIFNYKAVDLSAMPDYLRMARDRVRFKRRIRHIDSQIGYVFNPSHRRYVENLLNELQIIETFNAQCKMDAAFQRSTYH